MRLVSFDPLRTLGWPGVDVLKPEAWFRAQEQVRAADWVLFPAYWQVNTLAYAWRKRIFPNAATYHLGHDKVEMTRAFEAVVPHHTPQTLILPNEDWAREQVLDELRFPFVAKERRSSMGQGVWLIRDRAAWRAWHAGREELYVQEYLPIERDVRVVWVGDEVLLAYWREAPEGGFHTNVARGGRIVLGGVPDEAIRLVTDVATALGVDHAGFDVALVDGFPYLLEFNVRFGTRALEEHGVAVAPAALRWLERTSVPPIEPGGTVWPRAG
ncbi:MAG: hypothetical protein R3E98_16035 [Gemmatimonadota bacterium]|nr:ATP-grasp domain-containing protein [Gemmatimonadota bacterium]